MTDKLLPLVHSHEVNQLEKELKELFIKLYEDALGDTIDDINVYGVPHLGSFGLVERNIEQDGLTVLRETSEERIRYLFKAWRNRNPERGLFFLSLYLDAVFGGFASMNQMWQRKDAPYPTALMSDSEIVANSQDPEDFFLTSRVRVQLDTDVVPGKLLASLRSAVAARLLLNVQIGKFTLLNLGIAQVATPVNVCRLNLLAEANPGPVDPELPPVFCGVEVEYSGGQSFPTSRTIVLGSGLGFVTLRVQTFEIPDKIEVWVGENKILDTGYIGAPGYQSALDAELASRSLPLETITQEAGNNYFSFYKDWPEAEATVKVYAPLPGTAWNFTLSCPGEVTWFGLPTGLNTGATSTARSVRRGSSDVWVAGFVGGYAARSVDNGLNWTPLPRGLNSGATTQTLYFAETDGNGVWVAVFANGYASRSSDNGATWTALPVGLNTEGLTNTAFGDLVTNGNGVWIASLWSGREVRSADNGVTWESLPNGLNSGASSIASDWRCMDTDKNGTWIVGRDDAYASISTDDGATWTALPQGLNSGTISEDITCVVSGGNGVWMVGFRGGFAARSSDNGVTWTALPVGLNAGEPNEIIANFATDGAGTWLAFLGWASSARSIDGGITWVPLTKGLTGTNTSQSYLGVKTDYNGTWVVGRNSGFAHLSNDNGATWIDLPKGLNSGGTNESVFAIDTDYSGVWVAGLGDGYAARGVLT